MYLIWFPYAVLGKYTRLSYISSINIPLFCSILTERQINHLKKRNRRVVSLAIGRSSDKIGLSWTSGLHVTDYVAVVDFSFIMSS